MMTALQIGATFVLTAILLTVATVLAAFQLGRAPARDDEQRRFEVARAPRIRNAVRSTGAFGDTR